LALKASLAQNALFKLALRSKFNLIFNLYNNLAKPFTTVGADPFYAQTSGPRLPIFLQAYLKLAAEDK
jgi:hypothetical protein